jgi:hypothetical protein
VLAKTPPSSIVDPPDLSCVEVAASDYLEESCDTEDLALTAVKTVHNAIKRLLGFTWDVPRETVQESLTNMIETAESRLKKRLPDHRDAGKQLMELMDDIGKSWNIKVRYPDDDTHANQGIERDDLTYSDWRRADVRWVSNPTFFTPSRCPKMLVGKSGVYDSPDHYIDTVLRLWVAMTFADGYAALAPHCRAHGTGSGACGNALWPVSSTTPTMRCRSRGCSGPVEYSCRIKGHDSLCTECAATSVRQHCEGPGQTASTHVYDADVDRCNEDGIVYLKNFKCRNPPPNVHWRTTKRLSPPNLVALVVLKRRGATLEPSDRIVWGEVVYHGDNRDEERRRLNGQLAVNVWSLLEDVDLDSFLEASPMAVVRDDCVSSAFSHDHLD